MRRLDGTAVRRRDLGGRRFGEDKGILADGLCGVGYDRIGSRIRVIASNRSSNGAVLFEVRPGIPQARRTGPHRSVTIKRPQPPQPSNLHKSISRDF